MFVLGIDTCGPAGSVALGSLTNNRIEILSQIGLEGRTYSATLVAAIADVLGQNGLELGQVGCIVVVSGPGSFTGVRVGLSAAKGLAEGAGIPVIAVSRLQVLSHKSGIASAALDAHRHEIFLRLQAGDHQGRDKQGRELLAGATDLATLDPRAEIAVCDSAAVDLLAAAWPAAKLLRVAAPDAGDALSLAIPLISARHFADIALLDGHYLRRSDAEIFGNPAVATTSQRS
jgi:tRNA threonylcarbamoyladenosine biosynthesis protein TsaB